MPNLSLFVIKCRHMETKYLDRFNEWKSNPQLDEESKKALLSMSEAEIEDAFFRELAFGTGGLRGVLGVGTNRMNQYTVRKATQGLANYLKKHFKNARVAIGYDSRLFSREFAYDSASVLSSNGIEAFIYPVLLPTPVVSFTVRRLNCQAGIMVTASHNPKEYNGYKVYGPDGCQATDELANAISAEIDNVNIFKDVKVGDNSLVHEIGDDIYQEFLASTIKKSLLPKGERSLKIAYTPLNGTGRVPVQDILHMDGFNNIEVVKEQEMPDGNFTTCPYPNPEMRPALELGVKLLKEKECDILIANDPDCDRIGMVSRDKDGIHYYTGNEVGVLLFDYVYESLKVSNRLPKHPFMVKTIVTSDMVNVMAEEHGITVKDVLTGFKYIGEQIGLLEKANRVEDFLLGYEESCGYLNNTDIRDKDAVNASMLVAELCEFLLKQGKTPYQRLNELYDKYGRYQTALWSFEFKGVTGLQKMNDFMLSIRKGLDFPNGKVVKTNDYLASTSRVGDKVEVIDLPKSNVMKYYFNNGDTVTIRPSGTEPKLKVYVLTKHQENIEVLQKYFQDIIK